MVNLSVYRKISLLLVLCTATVRTSLSQEQPLLPKDLLQERVAGFTLKDETIIDGIAKLSQITNVSFSVEFELGSTISKPAPEVKKVETTLGEVSISEALDRLCAIDDTFTWIRIGNHVNLVPRRLLSNNSYFLNRKIKVLTFVKTPDAQKAVFQAVDQLPPPKEQVAMMESGTSLAFAEPWTATFKNITVREAIDKIAEQLGPTMGWQFGGGEDFRILTFHQRLAVKPKQQSAELDH